MSVYRVRNFNLFIYLIKKPVSEYRHFYNTLVHFACYVEQINKTNIFRWLFRDIIFVWFCHSLCNISYVVFHLTWKLRHMGLSQVMWIYFVIQFIIKLLKKKIMKQKVFNILLFTIASKQCGLVDNETVDQMVRLGYGNRTFYP